MYIKKKRKTSYFWNPWLGLMHVVGMPWEVPVSFTWLCIGKTAALSLELTPLSPALSKKHSFCSCLTQPNYLNLNLKRF